MNTGADPIERLIQQAELIAANALHGQRRRQEVAERAERDGNEAGRLAALAFVVMYQEQMEGAQRLVERLRRVRSAVARHGRRETSTATPHLSTVARVPRCQITRPHEHSSFDDPIDCPWVGAPSTECICGMVGSAYACKASVHRARSQDVREATYAPEGDGNAQQGDPS